VYYEGNRRVRKKFSKLVKAKAEADLVVAKLANGETEVLKLTGVDRSIYIAAKLKLQQWKSDADLNLVVADYLGAVSRLPKDASLKDCVDFYVKRHPAGLQKRTVQEVLGELIKTKEDAGRSDVFIKDLRSRVGNFAKDFPCEISTVTGRQIDEYIRARGLAPRTQNNIRLLINMLFKFAIRRGYLPKDHDEMSGVEKADDSGGEIEIFTVEEMRKLFESARPEMIPYLAVGAFSGLRAAEIQRLDWSEVNL